HSLHAATTGVQITHDVAAEFLRRGDFHIHYWLQQRWFDSLHGGSKCLATGRAERMLVGINRVIRTIDQLHFEINQWVAGNSPSLPRPDDSFLNSRTNLWRSGPPKNLSPKHKPPPSRQRLEDAFALAKRAATAGLFLVSALPLGSLRYRFFIWN